MPPMKAAVIASVTLLVLLLSPARHADDMLTPEMLQQLKANYSDSAYRRGLALNQLIEDLQDADVPTKLREVNRFFNQFPYREDRDHWGVEDYWATPSEFLGTQAGDCEDYVVAKYFALRKLGLPDEKLYLTYVKALEHNIAHMVLSYFETPASIPLVLDNYNPEILIASQRRDLLPVYSFNASSLFLSNPSAGLGKALPTDKIKNSKWQKLLSDIRKEEQ